MDARLIDTLAPPAESYRSFKRALTIAIVADLVVGLALLCLAGWVVEFLGLAPVHPLVWVRCVGLLLLALAVVHAPLRIAPQANAFLATYAIGLRGALFVFFLIAGLVAAGGFLWLALYEVLLGVLLGLTFWRDFRSHLMAQP